MPQSSPPPYAVSSTAESNWTRPPTSHSQGLISGVPQPFCSFQGIVSMWSVNVWPNLSSLAGGIVLGDLFSSTVTAEAWGQSCPRPAWLVSAHSILSSMFGQCKELVVKAAASTKVLHREPPMPPPVSPTSSGVAPLQPTLLMPPLPLRSPSLAFLLLPSSSSFPSLPPHPPTSSNSCRADPTSHPITRLTWMSFPGPVHLDRTSGANRAARAVRGTRRESMSSERQVEFCRVEWY